MTDSSLTISPRSSRLDFKQLVQMLFHPAAGLDRLATQEKATWLLPMLVVSLLFLGRVILGGYFQAHAAAVGQVQLPADWQYWSTDMQNNYMQAQQATQGPVFVYVIPATIGLVKFWLSWLIVSGLTHLTSTLFGGRGKMGSALNIVAWACLPFALRDLLRIVFTLIAKHGVVSSGLSGFVTTVFISKFLASIDLFFVWFAILLIAGIHKADNLPVGKAVLGVLIVLIICLLAQAGLGTLTSKLGGLVVSRPF